MPHLHVSNLKCSSREFLRQNFQTFPVSCTVQYGVLRVHFDLCIFNELSFLFFEFLFILPWSRAL